MGSVTINGKTYHGNNIYINNDQVVIDGVKQVGVDEKIVIERAENVELHCDEQVIVKGNMSGTINAMGSVTCNDVDGNIESGGSVNCDNVKGSVTAGGSVNCDNIGGSVRAGGSINHD